MGSGWLAPSCLCGSAMDLLSQRLRTIGPSHAARAIDRFLERGAPASAGGAGGGMVLSEDVRGQLEAMRAALLRGEKAPGGKGGGGRRGGAGEAEGSGGGGGEERDGRKQKKRREG